MGSAFEYQPEKLKKLVDAAIDKNLVAEMTSGVVVLVSYDGNVVYRRAAGLADREAGYLMQENTLFRFASISKAFTSLAAAALIQQGKLSFDDTVAKWLPYFTPKQKDGTVPDITIRQMLCHMAGLDYRWSQKEDGPYATAGVTDGLDVSGISLEENLKRIAKGPLLFAPGSSWMYSLAPDVMGAVIAKIHGTDFQTALSDLVLRPLGIANAGFSVAAGLEKTLAAPYYLNDAKKLTRMTEEQYLTDIEGRYFHFTPARAFRPEEYPSGGVGLIGTAGDLLRLTEAIRTNKAPFADETLMKTMSENQLPAGLEARPGIGFCLGWGILLDPVRAENTPQTPGTLAWGGVYGSKWFADQDKKLSVVIMTTTSLDEVVGVDIRNAIYEGFAK